MPPAKSKSRLKSKSGQLVRRLGAQRKPIALYYWMTPNGRKISIMLEECKLPYDVKPINIGRGEQFSSEFLAISPNHRIPAIVDPQGPGGRPISIFESGAILQYLGRKTGKFYPREERRRVDVDQWLFWQVGGLGPMAGQANHFRIYAADKIPYAIDRYTNECRRLYGVMNRQLKDREFLAGAYSIADIACIGWASQWQRQGQDINEFPHFKRWLETLLARPAVRKGMELSADVPAIDLVNDAIARKILFNQGARG